MAFVVFLFVRTRNQIISILNENSKRKRRLEYLKYSFPFRLRNSFIIYFDVFFILSGLLRSDFSFRFSPGILPGVHSSHHHVLNSHPAIVTPGPKQDIGQDLNHRYSRLVLVHFLCITFSSFQSHSNGYHNWNSNKQTNQLHRIFKFGIMCRLSCTPRARIRNSNSIWPKNRKIFHPFTPHDMEKARSKPRTVSWTYAYIPSYAIECSTMTNRKKKDFARLCIELPLLIRRLITQREFHWNGSNGKLFDFYSKISCTIYFSLRMVKRILCERKFFHFECGWRTAVYIGANIIQGSFESQRAIWRQVCAEQLTR